MTEQSTLNTETAHALNELNEVVQNIATSRQKFFDKFMDPRRSIDDECGFPSTNNIDIRTHYKELYDREGVATRVVQVMPDECWAIQPEITEDEDVEVETAFELAFEEMSNGLRGQSWYKGNEGSPFWEVLRRADILSGIGFYGVILLGLDDGIELEEPAEGITDAGVKTGNTQRKLLYMRAFDQSLVEIAATEQDNENPRYGQPTIYTITLNDPQTQQVTAGVPTSTIRVHWSRIIHIADNIGSNELWGDPRMRPVLNNLLSLRKLYAGSAEMYWRGAFPGLSFETQPQLGADVEIDTAALREAAEQYMNTLQRYIQTSGFNVKTLAPQVVDPSKQIEVQLDAICIKITIPKRIFIGSERGELASSQDSNSWNGRVHNRQTTYVTPRIIVPAIDRLIILGVLPEPQDGYSVTWSDLNSLSEMEQAELASKRTDAMTKYVQAEVADNLMVQKDFLTRVMNFPDDVADAIIEATMEAIEAAEKEIEFEKPEDIEDTDEET
jgi:uncharacterized protein